MNQVSPCGFWMCTPETLRGSLLRGDIAKPAAVHIREGQMATAGFQRFNLDCGESN
jgi:hypothetical protein